ncbi:phage integrase SAM-like domain-containing protein [Eudoraea adriatica]|uniref:phage integrase SAM-like domain-containing protein n=1 Tax=Eudoraea adriatica TaxID=446681 RepID=UPI0003754804|nr:phage integrase SAM-like domain-containing protein [Eudoraea adriatica]
MTIRLTLDPRLRKDNTNTILIKIGDGRNYRKKLSTPLKIEKRFWDDKKERVKNTYKNSRILNKELDELNAKIRIALDKYSAKQFTRQQVVSYVSGKTDFDTVDGYIETVIKNSREKPTYIDYRTTINSLKKHTGYSKDRPLLFHEVNFNLLSNFKLKSKENGMSATAYNSYLTKIRTVMNDAYDKGYIFDKFTFDRRLKRAVKPKIIKTASPDQIFKGIEKVKSIYDFQAIGFWILMFGLRGMYPADVVDISISHLFPKENQDIMDEENQDIMDDVTYILHTRSKTSESANVDLVIRVDEILWYLINTLKKSIVYTHLPKKPQIIPHIEDILKIFDYNPSKEYTLHQNTWDVYKKKVKRLTGLSYNKARKTFDTIAMELSVPETVRRVLLGHADPSMLAHYGNTQSERFQEQVEEAHKSVLKDFKVKEMVEKLLFKLDGLDMPYWILEEWKQKDDEIILSDEELKKWYREEAGTPQLKDLLKKEEKKGIYKFVENTLSDMDTKTRKMVKLDKWKDTPWKYKG